MIRFNKIDLDPEPAKNNVKSDHPLQRTTTEGTFTFLERDCKRSFVVTFNAKITMSDLQQNH